MKKIIEVKEINKKFFTCNVCDSDINVKEIVYGDDIKTSSFRLCEKCREELKKKL